MTIYFMDMRTGRVVARSQAVKVQNGQLVPDSLGLPVIVMDEDTDPDEDRGLEVEYD